MTADPDPENTDVALRAAQLLRGAATADQRAARRLRARITDIGADGETRLDDRLRALVNHHLRVFVERIESTLREETARLLVTRGERTTAARLRGEGGQAYERLCAAGLLDDEALLGELMSRFRHDILAERLPQHATGDDEPSLLARLADVSDTEVALAARALLVAESRRREALAFAEPDSVDLPAESYHRLVWCVAATLRRDDAVALDRVLADATGRLLATHDEGERAEARAMRLALAIDARPGEWPALIEEALGDRRLSLVVAALAQAAHLSFEQVRALVVEPDDERWWLVLRSIDLDPLTIARIGLALTDADPRRRREELPDILAAVNAITPADAHAALATLRLPAELRCAAEALAQVGRA
jgi:hypothetical protein